MSQSRKNSSFKKLKLTRGNIILIITSVMIFIGSIIEAIIRGNDRNVEIKNKIEKLEYAKTAIDEIFKNYNEPSYDNIYAYVGAFVSVEYNKNEEFDELLRKNIELMRIYSEIKIYLNNKYQRSIQNGFSVTFQQFKNLEKKLSEYNDLSNLNSFQLLIDGYLGDQFSIINQMKIMKEIIIDVIDYEIKTIISKYS